jgi:hypothetical protein
VLVAALSGRRLMRWVLAYSACDLADSLQAPNPIGTNLPSVVNAATP